MKAVAEDRPYDLVNPRNGQVTRTLSARGVFDLIVGAAWKTGDPGAEGVNHVGILIVDKFGNVGVLQNTNSGVRFTSLEDASRNGGPSWRDTFRCLRRPSFD